MIIKTASTGVTAEPIGGGSLSELTSLQTQQNNNMKAFTEVSNKMEKHLNTLVKISAKTEKNTDTKNRALSLAVSHDTILAAFIAVISGHFQVQKKDWPEMMEGVFIWFENTSSFEASQLNWVWRGERHQLNIHDLKANI
jgi:hypothetical protein